MVPLQRFVADFQATSPYVILVLLFVGIAAIWRHARKPEHDDNWATPPKEAGKMLLTIICIWSVQIGLHLTLGDEVLIGGIRLHAMLDLGHIGAVFNLLMRSLLRLLP